MSGLRLTIVILSALTISAAFPALAAKRNCTYSDYKYKPHPDLRVGGGKPRDFQLTIEDNPDFDGPQGGIREYYRLSVIEPDTQRIASTLVMPYSCNAQGVVNCKLDVKGHSKNYDTLQVSILSHAMSGSMRTHADYMILIPGLLPYTRNTDFNDDNVEIFSKDYDFLPYFVPEHWIAYEKKSDCASKR